MQYFTVIVLIGLIPAAIAQSKGRSFIAWWFYGSLLFIVALPHALMMGQREGRGRRKCPYCAEMILEEATVCRFCGRDLVVPEPDSHTTAAVDKISPPLGPRAARTSDQDDALAAEIAAMNARSDRGARPFGIAAVIGLGLMFIWLLVVVVKTQRAAVTSSSRPSSAAEPAAQSPPPAALPYVYADFDAPVRSRPSQKAPIIRREALGAKLEYLAQSGGWYRLATADSNVREWVSAKSVLSASERAEREGSELRLESWSWGTEYGYATAQGQVTNVSGRTLENVMALVTFMTKSGEFITSDDALIQYTTLLPGQTSPWKVMERENPAMATARVEFRTFAGERIQHYARRK